MEFSKPFEVGDMVEVYKRIIGYITYIDYKKEEADVEWDEGDSNWTSAVVSFKYLKKVEE